MKRLAVLLSLVAMLAAAGPAGAAPEGQLTWAVHITLAPTWFDPAETPGLTMPVSSVRIGAVLYRARPGIRSAGQVPVPPSC